jgi:hypothetical protein
MAGETAYPTTDNQWFAGLGGVGIQPAQDFFSNVLRPDVTATDKSRNSEKRKAAEWSLGFPLSESAKSTGLERSDTRSILFYFVLALRGCLFLSGLLNCLLLGCHIFSLSY